MSIHDAPHEAAPSEMFDPASESQLATLSARAVTLIMDAKLLDGKNADGLHVSSGQSEATFTFNRTVADFDVLHVSVIDDGDGEEATITRWSSRPTLEDEGQPGEVKQEVETVSLNGQPGEIIRSTGRPDSQGTITYPSTFDVQPTLPMSRDQANTLVTELASLRQTLHRKERRQRSRSWLGRRLIGG